MRYERFDDELPELAKTSPVEAACLAAMPVVDAMIQLQTAFDECRRHPRILGKARDNATVSQRRRVHNMVRTWAMRLDADVARLDRLLTDNVFNALSDVHQTAVKVGSTAADSYTDAAFLAGNSLLVTMAMLTRNDLLAFVTTERPSGQPFGIDGDAVIAELKRLITHPDSHKAFDWSEWHINIRKECARAQGGARLPRESNEPKCRLSVESDNTGDYVVLDGTRYPSPEPAAQLVREAIATRDWVSGKSLEPECRSRDIDRLPKEIQSLIVRKVPLGYRLSPDAWL